MPTVLKYRLRVPTPWRMTAGVREEAFVFLEISEPEEDVEIQHDGSYSELARKLKSEEIAKRPIG